MWALGIDMTDLQKSLVNMKSFGASFSGVKYSDIEVIPSSFLSMNPEKVISIQDQEKYQVGYKDAPRLEYGEAVLFLSRLGKFIQLPLVFSLPEHLQQSIRSEKADDYHSIQATLVPYL